MSTASGATSSNTAACAARLPRKSRVGTPRAWSWCVAAGCVPRRTRAGAAPATGWQPWVPGRRAGGIASAARRRCRTCGAGLALRDMHGHGARTLFFLDEWRCVPRALSRPCRRRFSSIASDARRWSVEFALQIALPLSFLKFAIVLKAGARRPVSHISSTLRWDSRSSRRLD